MQHSTAFLRSLALLATLFLTACAGNTQQPTINPISDTDGKTADLADVVADTLELSEAAGRENILVVLDIDNTLLAMEQGLGADQWYEWQKNISENDHCNPHNVGNRFAVQGALYFASAMRPTQEDAAIQVGIIQSNGIRVIALTSRGLEFRLQTFRELRRNDYSFAHSAIGPSGGYEAAFVPVKDGRLSLYEDGVFLTAGQHKGEMLQALLQKTNTRLPTVIIVADDNQKNLDAIKETFNAMNIPVHAWLYTGEDENVAAFDPEQAHSQWKSIEAALRQIQKVLGPDNYDLSSAVRVQCKP